MFEFPLLIFAYGILTVLTSISAQERVWSCSFGMFGPSPGPQSEPCNICLDRRERDKVYWFETSHDTRFGAQPYFRASLNNERSVEWDTAECTILNITLNGSRGIFSFRYLFNSVSTTGRYGYFNYSVCKDEGTVHQLHTVDGWAYKEIPFNCSEVEITLTAVRGDSYADVGIDNVTVMEDPLTDVSGRPIPSNADMPTVSATTPTGEQSTRRPTENSRQVILIASSVIAVCLLCVISIFFIRRRCRSKPKHPSSEGSDTEGDTGLVMNELDGARGDSPLASDTIAGDKPISDTTNADALYTNVGNDFEGIAGGRCGDSAGRSTACDGNTYFTLEVPPKDGSTHYSCATNADALYTNVDNDFEGTAGGRSGDLAGRSTACDGNTYFSLEAPTKDGSTHNSSATNADALYTNVDNDFEGIAGGRSGDSACDGNTYFTLEASTKDVSTHYSSATNVDALYTNVDDFEGTANANTYDNLEF